MQSAIFAIGMPGPFELIIALSFVAVPILATAALIWIFMRGRDRGT